MAIETKGDVAEIRAILEDYLPIKQSIVRDPITGIDVPVSIGQGGVELIGNDLFDPYRPGPAYRRGEAKLTSIDSFIAHANRFKGDISAVFACDDRTRPSLTSVLDYHPAGAPGTPASWGRHRGSFAFPLSDEWKAWTGASGKVMGMAAFAAFLEDHIIDVLPPASLEDLPDETKRFVAAAGGSFADAAKLMDLARGLQVNEKAAVKEAVNLSTGEGQVMFQSEHVDAAGKPLKVPNLFAIGIPVFRSDAPYRLVARLRYRKTDEGLKFWFDLWRADRVFDHAFATACKRVETETGLPLLFGAPEA